MIVKLLELALLVSVALRMLTGRWPWDMWRESEKARVERQARNLLGVPNNASREDIIDAHRSLIARVHPDRGGTSEAVHEANAARDALLERLGPRVRG